MTGSFSLCIIIKVPHFRHLTFSTAGQGFLCPPSSKCGGPVAAAGFSYVMEVSCNVPYLSAQEAPALQGARLPQENGYCQRPQGSGSSSCQGSRSSDPLRSRKVHPAWLVKNRDGGRENCRPYSSMQKSLEFQPGECHESSRNSQGEL